MCRVCSREKKRALCTHSLTPLPPLPLCNCLHWLEMHKTFCSTLLCHSLQTYFPRQSYAKKKKKTFVFKVRKTCFDTRRGKVNVSFGKAQMDCSVQRGLQPVYISFYFFVWWISFSKKKSKPKSLSLWEDTFLPPLNQIPFTDNREGEKAGKAHRCQRTGGRGQRSRVGDLGSQQTCLPFPTPLRHNGLTLQCFFSYSDIWGGVTVNTQV